MHLRPDSYDLLTLKIKVDYRTNVSKLFNTLMFKPLFVAYFCYYLWRNCLSLRMAS